ncbi:MAG: rRNA maturation RNase YbeY [Candidatus Acidiferrales bacterium]
MVLNHQRRVRVAIADLERFLGRARRVLRLPVGSLTVCLVTNVEIARWNRAYRGKRGATDVLSFPVEATQGNRRKGWSLSPRRRRPSSPASSYLGDIAIAPAVAMRNARRFGRTFNDEMRILVLHGILHLMGYDHETDTGQMDRREARLRRLLGLA